MGCLCIVCIECFIKFDIIGHLLVVYKTSRKSVGLVTSNAISDHWKEKALPKYSLKMLWSSSIMLVAFIFMIALFAIAFYIKEDFLDFTLSVTGILVAILLSTIYAMARQRLRK